MSIFFVYLLRGQQSQHCFSDQRYRHFKIPVTTTSWVCTEANGRSNAVDRHNYISRSFQQGRKVRIYTKNSEDGKYFHNHFKGIYKHFCFSVTTSPNFYGPLEFIIQSLNCSVKFFLIPKLDSYKSFIYPTTTRDRPINFSVLQNNI